MKKLIPTLLFLCALTSAYAQTDMLNGLRAHYSFDGNVADISGNNFGGTLKGLAHVNDVRLILNDNNKDNLTLPAEILNGAGDFSITFKVAFNSFHVSGENNPTNTVVSAWGSELDRIWIAYNRNTKTWDFSINGEMVSYSANFINENNLYCLFFVREGDSATIYVDADKFATFPINTAALDISNLVIGQHANCTDECFLLKQCLNGRVEQLAFWDRALNSDEIDLACHIPIASFTSESAPCADGSAIFTNWSEHADFYTWDFGDGNTSTEWSPVHTYGASGEYTITLISTNQWNDISDTITQTITVSTAGLSAGISAAGSTIICDGSSVELSASPEDATSYQWWQNGSPIDGATSQTYVATSAGTYSVNVTNSFGCSGTSDGLEVSVNASPAVTISPSGAVDICEGSTQTFTASSDGDVSYQWLMNGSPIPGATGDSFTADASGVYTVQATNASLCSSTSAGAALTVNANPLAEIAASGPTEFCEGSSVSLAATEGDEFTYQWQLNGEDISGATAQTYTAASGGAYTVNIVNSSGCSDASEGVQVSVNANPSVSIEPAGAVAVCEGNSQLFTATADGDASYQWMINGSPIPGATENTYTASGPGIYSVMVTNTNECSSNSANAALTVNANPVAAITAGGPVAFCEGGNVDLAATEGDGFTYQWQFNGSDISGATGVHFSASEEGEYSVIILSGEGCSDQSESVAVSVKPNPPASIEPDGVISACAGSGQEFTANDGPGLSYQWMVNGSPIEGETDLTFTTNVSGDYSVVVTASNGCSTTSATVSLNVNANPEITITSNGSTTLCEGQSVELVANGVGNLEYEWKYDGDVIPGATDPTYVASEAGTYTVKVTDTNGCKNAADPITVIVNPVPIANIDPAEDVSFCSGNSQVYSANDGIDLSYQWTWNGEAIDGATGISYEATESGAYAVIVTDAAGCSASSSVSNLTVNALPDVSVSSNGPTEFCDGGSVELSASGGESSYQWFMNGEEIDGANSENYTATGSGSYSVVITDANGCKNQSEEITVNVNANPVATIDPISDVSFCEGGVQVYEANDGDGLSYQWTWNGEPIEGATASSYEASQTGTYAVIVTNESGCTAASSGSTLTVNANPEAIIDPADAIELCEGESAALNANSGDNLSYQWQMNGEAIDGATNQSYSTGDAGNYSVVVTSDAGCSTVSAEVTVSVNPLPVFSLGSDTTICDTSSITLDAGAGFESYEWSTDETTQTITVNESGIYSVTVVDANGCSATDEMELTVDVCTGISEATFASSVTIYPNPSFGLFTISVNLPAVDRIRIDLTNTLGQLVLPVYDGQLTSSFSREVDMKEYAKGVYFVRFMFDGQVVNKKIVNAE